MIELPPHRFEDSRVAVAQRKDAVTSEAVDVARPFQIGEIDAFRVGFDVVETADFKERHLGGIDEVLILLDHILRDLVRGLVLLHSGRTIPRIESMPRGDLGTELLRAPSAPTAGESIQTRRGQATIWQSGRVATDTGRAPPYPVLTTRLDRAPVANVWARMLAERSA